MSETTQSLADLQAEYQEKITKALGNAKTKLKVELELASMTFDSIVKAGEAGIWQSPTLAPILKSLGLQPAGGTEVGNGRKVKRRGRGPAKKVKVMGDRIGNGKKVKGDLTPTEKKYVAYIAKGEVSQQAIAKKMKSKNPSNLLTKLREMGKIDFKKDGLKKIWFTK
jgi:hypothetical protein